MNSVPIIDPARAGDNLAVELVDSAWFFGPRAYVAGEIKTPDDEPASRPLLVLVDRVGDKVAVQVDASSDFDRRPKRTLPREEAREVLSKWLAEFKQDGMTFSEIKDKNGDPI